jgi:hypothetical protein
MVKVSCKPISQTADDFQKGFRIDRTHPEPSSLIIDNYRPELRIGAFEVQLCTRINRELTQELLHSKLATRTWPNVKVVLDKIAKYIPHTNIKIKLYTTATESENRSLKGT